MRLYATQIGYRIRCNYSATTFEASPSTGTYSFITKPSATHLPELF